jgi:hypothetical protein
MPLNRFYLLRQEEDQVADTEHGQEEEAWKTQAPRQGDLQEGKMDGGEVLRVGREFQEAGGKV